MAGSSVHLDYEQTAKLYHRVVADLTARYTPRGGRVLDVGCGVGHVLHDLARRDGAYRLTGADVDEQCLRVTAERVPGARTVRLPPGDLDLAAIDRPHDTCVMSHVLEHLGAPRNALDQALGKLDREGVLVLAVPNLVNPVSFLKAGLGRSWANRGHVVAWDRAHWINFLENIPGLRVLEYAHDEVFLFPRRWPVDSPLKRVERLLGRLFPAWSFSSIAVVRRDCETGGPERGGTVRHAPSEPE